MINCLSFFSTIYGATNVLALTLSVISKTCSGGLSTFQAFLVRFSRDVQYPFLCTGTINDQRYRGVRCIQKKFLFVLFLFWDYGSKVTGYVYFTGTSCAVGLPLWAICGRFEDL